MSVASGVCVIKHSMLMLSCVVKPELRKGAQWRKVASRGDGTTTAEVVCQAEGIPRVDFSWEKNGVRMDFANPRSARRHPSFFSPPLTSVLLSAFGYILMNPYN